ncbi:Lsr2 family protein [soil metagenome]
MATKTLVTLIDDIDGKSRAAETVAFSLDGIDYEIDLTAKHASKLRTQVTPWMEAARRTGGTRRPARQKATDSDSTDIRSWARAHGYDVGDRGRIPQDASTAFRAANRT